MRHSRLKLNGGPAPAYYHCMSRVVNRDFLFGDLEKEQFVAFMREYEQFCGVQVLTYCVMSNHFHILVEVPPRPTILPTAEELIGKLKGLSSTAISAGKAEQMIEMFRRSQDTKGEQEYLESFFGRMWDVSEFMKLLKQRFSSWYNRTNERKGTLWEERFKSILVDGVGEALITMAAYIDLNSVRAGLVTEPQEYRWSGYGEALAGRKRAKLGLLVVASAMTGRAESPGKALELYRWRLFGQGEEREGSDEDGEPLRRGFQRETVLAVIRNKGVVSPVEYVRCRVRYFTDGMALGSQDFVNGVFRQFREHFSPRRADGARGLRGLKPMDLFTLRNLRRAVIG